MNPPNRLPPLVIFLGLSALALGLLAAPAAARNAYTLNYSEDSVSVIDTQTNQVVGSPIAVGEGPYTIAITPNGKTAYVANEASDDISVIDLQTEQIVGAPIPLGARPRVIAISPDGLTAYVTLESEVVLIDTQTNQVVGSPISIPGELWGVALTPDGKTAYVADEENDEIWTIDTQARQVVGSPIPVGEEPINVAFTPDGKTAYVVNQAGNDVSVIDTQAREVIATIPVGEEPWGIGITPDGAKAYVSNYEEETVTAIDTTTNQVLGPPIPAGNEPYEVAVTPDGKTAYVANYGDETVTAIDTQTDQPSAQIPVSGGPWQIVVAPDQSPTAAFSVGTATAGAPTAFNGLASSDPDGSITGYDWVFGDGSTAQNGGGTPTHTYANAGVYSVDLTVTDDEGCSTSPRFTGRTTYCGETSLASRTQPVDVKAKPVVSNKFSFGKLRRNRNNGTAKLQITVPGAGVLTLTGKKVRLDKRRAAKADTVTLTVRPKTRVSKALKHRHHVKVHFRVRFGPTGGTSGTRGKTIKLIRR